MKNEHLPIFGIGPMLCYPLAVLTAAATYLSYKGIIPGRIDIPWVKTLMTVLGILLILEGLALFVGADIGGKLVKSIKDNHLKTNGSYRFVRNPCYCLYLLGCTGVHLIAHNPYLLILSVVYYVWMSVVLINTEEKWLADLYGEEYKDYCRRVNRLIPWPSSFMSTKMRKCRHR